MDFQQCDADYFIKGVSWIYSKYEYVMIFYLVYSKQTILYAMGR